MSCQDALRTIESEDFIVRVNSASDYNIFMKAIRNEDATKELLRGMRSSESECQEVFSRLIELSKKQIDERYEHPWDTTLAVYLWLLSITNIELAKLAASIIKKIEQGWWSHKISNYILSRIGVNTNSTSPPIHDISKFTITTPSFKTAEYQLENNFFLDWVGEVGLYPKYQIQCSQEPLEKQLIKWWDIASSGVLCQVNTPSNLQDHLYEEMQW